METDARTAWRRIGLVLLFSGAILFITWIAAKTGILNPSSTAFIYLILIILAGFFSDLAVSLITSLVATLCFNYFFLPPVGTFWIASPNDWLTLITFFFAGAVISRLISIA